MITKWCYYVVQLQMVSFKLQVSFLLLACLHSCHFKIDGGLFHSYRLKALMVDVRSSCPIVLNHRTFGHTTITETNPKWSCVSCGATVKTSMLPDV